MGAIEMKKFKLPSELVEKGYSNFVYKIVDGKRKVKIKNSLTGEVEELKGFKFMYNSNPIEDEDEDGWGNNNGRNNAQAYNMIILSAEKYNSKLEMVGFVKYFDDINHTNCSWATTRTFYSGEYTYRINVVSFCNVIRCSDMVANEDVANAMMCCNLEEQNPTDSYRTVVSVSLTTSDHHIACSRCGKILKQLSNPLCLINNFCEECIQGQDIINKPTDYIKLPSDTRYSERKTISIKDRSTMSNYYKPITKKDIEKAKLSIPRVRQDILVVGLGSAGTGVLDQVGRTQLLKSYRLVDFDRVEEKNLRNQFYTQSNVGNRKVDSTHSILNSYQKGLEIKTLNQRIQRASLDFIDFKYIVAGLDTIRVRKDTLGLIAKGKLSTRYLIDLRYNDLDCSIYFIDTTDKDQLKYYADCLHEDYINLGEDKIKVKEIEVESITSRQLLDHWKKKNFFRQSCIMERNRLGFKGGGCGSSCDIPSCHKFLSDMLYEFPVSKKLLDSKKTRAVEPSTPPVVESSCYARNIIDIYKFASSYITATIREIEGGNAKPFTHIEVTTNGLPRSMVIKK